MAKDKIRRDEERTNTDKHGNNREGRWSGAPGVEAFLPPLKDCRTRGNKLVIKGRQGEEDEISRGVGAGDRGQWSIKGRGREIAEGDNRRQSKEGDDDPDQLGGDVIFTLQQ